jgi:hypothetical protein
MTLLQKSLQPLTRSKVAKKEGDIISVFSALIDKNRPPLPARFSDLKKQLWNDSLSQSWRGVLEALKVKTNEVGQKGSSVGLLPYYCPTLLLTPIQIIPKVSYSEIQAGLSADKVAKIKEAGVVVVQGAVSKDVRLGVL